MTAQEQFGQWIPKGATEQEPAIAGNVEFWWDNGRLCYSVPASRWDIPAMTAQLVQWAQETQQCA